MSLAGGGRRRAGAASRVPGTRGRAASALPAVELVCSSLPEPYVEKALEFLAASLETSRHLEFYLIWAQKLLVLHGQRLKAR